jgi:hypothetical protein
LISYPLPNRIYELLKPASTPAPTIHQGETNYGKPIIYFYPEVKTEVSVKLDVK